MSENNFKPGDRVEVVAAEDNTGYENGDTGTIERIQFGDFWVTFDGGRSNFVYASEVKLATPTPSLITIDRADLPEVVESIGFLTIGGCSFTSDWTAAERREWALKHIALAEFLEARETAAKEAADAERAAAEKLRVRRDELARELSPNNYRYEAHTTTARNAIDRIIALQDKLENTK